MTKLYKSDITRKGALPMYQKWLRKSQSLFTPPLYIADIQNIKQTYSIPL